MKITEIILEGFQSHKYTKLAVSEAITLVTGSSDSGKSALVRALRWVFFNRAPKGNFMLNEKDVTRVSLVYDSGDILVRERGPKVNQYRLNDDVYKALKADVPPEISNFHKVSLDNCQWQHPHLFLLDETPGNVAKRFNEVADLSLMTEATIVAKALVSSANDLVEATKAEIKKSTADLAETDWVPQAAVDLGEADKLVATRVSIDKQLGILVDAILSVQTAEDALARFPDLSGLVTVDKALEDYAAGQKVLDVRNQVAGAVEAVWAAEEALARLPDPSGLETVNITLAECEIRFKLQTARDQIFNAVAKVTLLQGTLYGLPSVEPTEVQRAIDLIEKRDDLLYVRNDLDTQIARVEDLEDKLKALPNVDVNVDVEGLETSRRTLTSDRSNLRRLIANVEKWQRELKAAEIRLVDAEEGYEKLRDEVGVCPECGQNLNHEGIEGECA